MKRESHVQFCERPGVQFLRPTHQRFPKLSREEAYMIASVAVDYNVTQVVDGTKGIHGMIPKAIFTSQ
jgi:acetamidase/formamidase